MSAARPSAATSAEGRDPPRQPSPAHAECPPIPAYQCVCVWCRLSATSGGAMSANRAHGASARSVQRNAGHSGRGPARLRRLHIFCDACLLSRCQAAGPLNRRCRRVCLRGAPAGAVERRLHAWGAAASEVCRRRALRLGARARARTCAERGLLVCVCVCGSSAAAIGLRSSTGEQGRESGTARAGFVVVLIVRAQRALPGRGQVRGSFAATVPGIAVQGGGG